MGKKTILLAASLLILSQVTLSKERTFVTKANGYSGEIKLEILAEGQNLKDIKIISHKESVPVMTRAFPIMKDRILEAQSPIVDSVSGATHTSTAIKRAVNDAYKKLGKDYGRITARTKGPELPPAYLEPVSTDLVIVGGGPAGLAAAISAKEQGLKNVILIEKMDMLSGNGKFDMNFYDLINSEAQKANGVNDTVENLIKDNSNPMDTLERTKAQAEGAFVLDKWLRDMGIKLNHHYGKRGHMAEKNVYAGEVIQDKMEARAKELGVDIRTSTKGLDLIIENGVATGVKVQNKNNFYDIKGKAIIVATGGFSANPELLGKYAPGTEKLQHSNQISATGDMIPVFEKNNIKLANLEVMNLIPFILGKTRDLAGPNGDGMMLVNIKGERFTKEHITKDERMDMAQKMLAQPESKVFYVFDKKLYDSSYRLQKHTKNGYHLVANSIEELAEKMGVPVETFKETVINYNKAVRGEIKDPFREGKAKREFDMTGPFYGVLVEPAVHMTRGGVVANEKTEVLQENGKILPGLYAAGEVTSTSAAYSASVIFGRIAGENAVKFINKN
ncbi:MAG: FAD-binding protein [Cetobacterium sp.]